MGNPNCKISPEKAPIRFRKTENCGTKKAIAKMKKVMAKRNPIFQSDFVKLLHVSGRIQCLLSPLPRGKVKWGK